MFGIEDMFGRISLNTLDKTITTRQALIFMQRVQTGGTNVGPREQEENK